MGTQQCSFERYHPRPPTAFSSLRLGVCNPHPKLQSVENCRKTSAHRGIVGMEGLWDFFGGGNRECGHSQELPEIFWYPYYLRNG